MQLVLMKLEEKKSQTWYPVNFFLLSILLKFCLKRVDC